MAKPFNELTRHFSEEDKRIVEKTKEVLVLEHDLISQLRKDAELTQKELAEVMEIRQAAISKIENQEDILVKTLERYVKALGGELELRAKFPDREVRLTQFVGGVVVMPQRNSPNPLRNLRGCKKEAR